MRITTSFLLSSSLLIIGACGSDGGGSSDVGSLINESVAAECSKAFECMSTFPGDPADFTDQYGANETECKTKGTPPPEFVTAIKASVSAGRIKFDSAKANQCIDGEQALTCDATTGFWGDNSPAVCDDVVHGTVAIGGTCTTWSLTISGMTFEADTGDCVDGAECDTTMKKCVMSSARTNPANKFLRSLATDRL